MTTENQSPDEEFLAEHGQRPAPEPAEVESARRQQATALAGEMDRLVQNSATSTELAAALRLDPPAVPERASRGDLYAFPWQGQPHYPTWQLVDRHGGIEPLPHLATVLAALPGTLHPLDVTHFFTRTPVPPGDDSSATVAEWLAAGGDVTPVLDLARGLTALG